MNENIKKTLKSVIASVSALAILAGSFVVSQSLADIEAEKTMVDAAVGTGSGGSGGGGGGGGNTGGWRDFGRNGIGNVDLSGYHYRGWTNPYNFMMASGGQRLVDTCTNYNVRTYVHTGDYGSAIWPHTLNNISGTNNLGVLGNLASHAGREIIVICENNPDRLLSTSQEYRVVRTTNSIAPVTVNNAIYSMSTTVAPEITVQGNDVNGNPVGRDPIGENNLHIQSSPTQKTNLGRLYDEIIADPQVINPPKTVNLANKYRNRVNNAQNADASAQRTSVNLDANNQAGMAEGGVLNVTEFGRPFNLTINSSQANFQLQVRTIQRYSHSGTRYGAWTNTGTKGQGTWANSNSSTWWSQRVGVSNGRWTTFSNSVSRNLATQRSLGFWQMISVNCNVNELNALRSAMPSLQVINQSPASGASTGIYNVTLRTNISTQRPAAVVGGTNHTGSGAAAKNAAGRVAFYDKECPFVCTPSANTANGASEDNGAVDNVGNSNRTSSSKGLYGNLAQKDDINGSYLELFRDNAANEMSPDVWYPVSSNGLSYDGRAPKSTIVSRLGSGTPNDTETSGASALEDVFRLTYTNSEGDEVNFFTSNSNGSYNARNNQGSSDVSPYSSETLGRAPGLASDIKAYGAWTSSDGRPQVVNIKWEYNPVMTKTVPLTNIGMRPQNSAGPRFTTGTVSTRVDGICAGNFGTTSNTNMQKLTNEAGSNTGSGTQTRWPVTVSGDPIQGSENIVLRFIRAVGE